jgi:exodeoxyribonuclease VII large subunit
MSRALDRAGERLAGLARLHASANPDRPLERGFARVVRRDGSLVRQGASLASGEAVELVFHDARRQAVVDGEPGEPAAPKTAKAAKPAKPAPPSSQGQLF